MYTLTAVFVHFNHFIDLKINFHTDPYNLASSRLLWFWAPCGVSTANFSPIRGIRIPDCRVESGIRNPESVILGVGIRNTAERIQNPTNNWNPESTAWNSVPKAVLDSLKVMLHETIRNNDF